MLNLRPGVLNLDKGYLLRLWNFSINHRELIMENASLSIELRTGVEIHVHAVLTSDFP